MNIPAAQHETRDAPPHRIAIVAATIALSLAVVWTLAQLWYRHEIGGQARLGEMQRQTSFSLSMDRPPLPILQDRAQAARESAANLNPPDAGDAGAVRIPIARAMQRIVQDRAAGLVSHDAAPPPPTP